MKVETQFQSETRLFLFFTVHFIDQPGSKRDSGITQIFHEFV